MAILDKNGNPYPTALTRKFPSSRVGTRNWDRITRGLEVSPEWIVGALDRAERGQMKDLVLLNRRMEERFPAYAGAMGQLKEPIKQAELRVEPASKTKKDREMADVVRRVLDSDDFHLAKPDMLDSIGVGFSIMGQRWAESGKHFVPVAWKHFRPELFVWEEEGTVPHFNLGTTTEPLDYGRWMTHVSRIRSGLPINGGLSRSVAMFYMFYSNAWLSYAALASIFGLPLRTGQYPDDAEPEDIEELRDALLEMGSDAVALFKQGMEIEVLKDASGNSGTNNFFNDYIDLLEKQVLIAVLGQNMTSLNNGSRAQAEVGERGKDLQVRAIAFGLGASWRHDVVGPIVELNIGPGHPLPKVYLDLEDGEDIGRLANGLAPLIDRGLKIRVADLLDRCGFSVPEGMPEDLEMHPDGESSASGDAKELGRVVMQICEVLDSGDQMRTAKKRIGKLVEAVGYSLKDAA